MLVSLTIPSDWSPETRLKSYLINKTDGEGGGGGRGGQEQ